MSGLLGNIKTNIAHNSKIHLGPKDLKSLGDILTSEKTLLSSTIRLSTETRKAAEALKEWGKSEGDDLGDVLSKLCVLFDQLASAQNRYSEHLSNFRQYFKSVRTREENLAALKKSKDSLQGKIDVTSKKLNKMSPEHKDFLGTQQKLRDMRQEMLSIEHACLNEEARLGDFKRDTTREALGLKLGALLEMSEKSTIIAELGKLLVEEIPRDRTEPGSSRVLYRGYTKTDNIIEEARRCLQEVVFNPLAGVALASPNLDQSEGSYEEPPFLPQMETTLSEPLGGQPSDREVNSPDQRAGMLNGNSNRGYSQYGDVYGGIEDHVEAREDQLSSHYLPPTSPYLPPLPVIDAKPTYQEENHTHLPEPPTMYSQPSMADSFQTAPDPPESPSISGRLGSKYGFDISTNTKDLPLSPNDYRTNTYHSPTYPDEMGYSPSGYSRGVIEAGSLGEASGRKMPASAFRRSPQPQLSGGSYGSYGQVSPAQAIRDHYRANSLGGDGEGTTSPLHVRKKSEPSNETSPTQSPTIEGRIAVPPPQYPDEGSLNMRYVTNLD